MPPPPLAYRTQINALDAAFQDGVQDGNALALEHQDARAHQVRHTLEQADDVPDEVCDVDALLVQEGQDDVTRPLTRRRKSPGEASEPVVCGGAPPAAVGLGSGGTAVSEHGAVRAARGNGTPTAASRVCAAEQYV